MLADIFKNATGQTDLANGCQALCWSQSPPALEIQIFHWKFKTVLWSQGQAKANAK